MVISKSAQKVINKADKPTAIKIQKALTNIQNGVGIEPLKQIQRGMESDLYRYKMEHYRIIFKKTPNELIIKSITTKSNTKFRRTGCKQFIWALSSVGQSARLITGWSRVRIPEGPPKSPYSSMVERRIYAPLGTRLVRGSGFESQYGDQFL